MTVLVTEMQETDLVMELMRELSRRDCNGHARIKLGTALADPERFRAIFSHYARGTYFEHVNLDIVETDPVVACSCGYCEKTPHPDALRSCPRCTGATELLTGAEFEILEPNGG